MLPIKPYENSFRQGFIEPQIADMYAYFIHLRGFSLYLYNYFPKLSKVLIRKNTPFKEATYRRKFDGSTFYTYIFLLFSFIFSIKISLKTNKENAIIQR